MLEVGKLLGNKFLTVKPPGLVRFVPKDDSSKVLIGQPTDNDTDVGVALREGKEVTVDVFDGSSVLSPGKSTGKNVAIERVLSPLTQVEAGTIRCIGLNVRTPMYTELCDTSCLQHYHKVYADLDADYSTSSTLKRPRWTFLPFQLCS